MSEKKNPDIRYPDQKIINVELEKEMKKSYIDYAMSVIVSRALPDVRDGLKPVHRRILYTMYEDGLTHEKSYRKSATTVGAVLGRYHPHGDASVYDALVRLAQDFSLRYPLVDGHGNFGSIDGDPPAAYRYTEARLARISAEMLRDIEKETITYTPNFDEKEQEPTVLPSRFPNLLVNGSSGIAVGMTTNIPPHNLRETIDACICVIDNPNAELDDLMEYVKGPDFPTKGIIMGRVGIRAAYATGRGKVKVRARAEIEEYGQNRTRIIVTELPYQVNKARLIENIAELVKDKHIDGISALRDESDRDGMRIVIELKREANSQVVLNRLYSATQLQTTFAMVLLALVNGQPKVLSLREILDEYIAFQKEVIIKRTEFELRKARDRAHILEGLRIAVDNIDEVIKIIRESYNDAKQRLMDRFELTDIQSQAILELQLRRLQGLEREKIENEYKELMEKIKYYLEILASDELIKGILKEELTEIRNRFGDERKTEITFVDDEIDIEDLIEEEDNVYTLTNAGYIKRIAANTYRAQRRGGKGITAMSTREEDFVETMFIASTHDYILFFTNKGRVHKKKGYQVPESGRTAKGMNIINLLPLEPNEKVTAMIPVREFSEDEYLVMVTNAGKVKRICLSTINTARKAGIIALVLDGDDELISVRKTDGNQDIIIATHDGRAICFRETDVRVMGRLAGGVRGIRLAEGDYVIGAARARTGGYLLSVTENGYGKRTDIEEYKRGGAEADNDTDIEDDVIENDEPDMTESDGKRPQRRGGKGLKNYNITDKTGKIAAVMVVDDNDDVMILSDDGTIIRMGAKDINTYSRSTQGVILMRLANNVKVISIARMEKDETDWSGTEQTETEQPENEQPEAEKQNEKQSTQET